MVTIDMARLRKFLIRFSLFCLLAMNSFITLAAEDVSPLTDKNFPHLGKPKKVFIVSPDGIGKMKINMSIKQVHKAMQLKNDLVSTLEKFGEEYCYSVRSKVIDEIYGVDFMLYPIKKNPYPRVVRVDIKRDLLRAKIRTLEGLYVGDDAKEIDKLYSENEAYSKPIWLDSSYVLVKSNYKKNLGYVFLIKEGVVDELRIGNIHVITNMHSCGN